MKKSIKTDKITLGVCYYPEHWDKSMWEGDLDRMKSLGIEVIRIAEFAWNKFEPTEGNFDFSFFDEFMDLALKKGIKVIFCTPTATPPAWMSEKYPEILNADIDGNLVHHGMRRQYTMNSPKYRFFTERIVEKIAEHYSKYENIVAWQLDNEINCETDIYRSESDDKAFRAFLKDRFKSLDALNDAIGAVFWNQTYTDWDEVHITRRTNSLGKTNPHMQLLEKRFVSETVIGYFKLQADIIRKYSHAPITTNGIFGHLDYQKLVSEVLDFITYDNYPNFAFGIDVNPANENGFRDRNSSYNLMRTRSISPVFGIMEQQSGPSGWNFCMAQPAPKPGQVRLWTLQSIAHGADYVSFFRFRTATFGTEIYWHGIYNYDNRPNRRSKEIENISSDVKKLKDVTGNEYYAEAAIVCDYDNIWDGENDVWHGKLDSISCDGWFRAFEKKHIPCDLVYINDDTAAEELSKYKLLVYPHPTILTEKRAGELEKYVRAGGTLIFGARTGYKDINGKCYQIPMPCHACGIVGATIDEFTFLSPYDEPQTAMIGGKKVSAGCFNDVIAVDGAKEISTFDTNYYSGKTALCENALGDGKAYYFGAAFCEDTALALIDLVGVKTPKGVDEYVALPESLELAIRGDYAFVLNFDESEKTFACHKAVSDILSGKMFEKEATIPPYGVIVFKI